MILRPKWLECWPGHVTLVEPSVGSTFGAPDASLVADRFPPGWVEFKAMDEDGWFVMRPEQRMWAKDFLRHSNRAALVIMDNEGFYITHIREVVASSYQPQYHAPSLRSHYRKVAWASIQERNLDRMLEVTYAS